METIELVKKSKVGDKEALLQLIMNKKQEYYKLAYVYMQNQEDTLDALEDTIVILYKKIKTLKKEEAFDSWSKTILVNRCKDLLRKRKKLIYLEEKEVLDEKDMIQNREDAIDLEKALKKLNPNQQEAIRLRYYMDYDYETIARLTNTPLGTVKSRIFNGIEKLKAALGGGVK
ncbi:RNA polymerase sigma-70 factor, ECF subfamily [Natronincola peptidivorans]|uniref:RNA polymerase sigma-70 factor, ECF subfamily n=1 Tax=Natronincola peptidivorans TaxID=426128 RepID=A0A1I0BUZ8_9FIRM|nr:sigma-70 family RNA polymerase sigma factor [Natronincola peptidivorans]SET10745.1 RNA polymerase sigma-70 factor, ECF subfamily [Natronincola peptidivorans]